MTPPREGGDDTTLVERVRMLLAEAGHPEATVHWNHEGTPLIEGLYAEDAPTLAWKAFTLASPGEGMPCLECYLISYWSSMPSRAEWEARAGRCSAQGQGLLDCGRTDR